MLHDKGGVQRDRVKEKRIPVNEEERERRDLKKVS